MTACGAAIVVTRRESDFPRFSGLESCRKWQRSFFYVRNPAPAEGTEEAEFLNLPEFNIAPPTAQLHWTFDLKTSDPEIDEIHEHLLSIKGELTAEDLLCTFVSRRVCPLQARVHKICHMSGRYDPTRVSIFTLTQAQVYRRVQAIAQAEMDEDWTWGLRPYSRSRPPPQVSSLT